MSVYISETELNNIAICCIYIQAGKALPNFPTSTRAAPSEQVVITRTTTDGLPVGTEKVFPQYIAWDLWQRIVVPLLIGDGQGLWIQYQRRTLQDWGDLLNGWVTLLREEINPTPIVEVITDGGGEPVLRDFPSPKVYPIVE